MNSVVRPQTLEYGPRTIADAQPSLDFIFQTLSSAEIHAQIGQRYAELGCLAGLSYATKCLVANTRAALATLAELQALQDQQEAASRPERIWTEEASD